MKSLLHVCIALLLSATIMQAQLPRTLSVQGVLTDNLSLPISDGIHKITINVYDKLEGGTPLFTEEFTTPVFKGLFNLSIGSLTPLPSTLTFDRPYFIGVSYDDKAEASRIILSSVPYAFMAATVPDGSITAEKLSPSLRTSIKGEKTLVNSVTGLKAFIGGGDNNTISNANYGTIVAGNGNNITSSGANGSIGGGYSNSLSANSATISGGYDNTNSGSYGTISGGNTNSNSGQYGSIGGGFSNNVTASYATIGGGNNSTASGQYSSIGGGTNNSATGSYTTIAGGISNSISGSYSAIAGGRNLTLNAANSFGYNGGSAMTIHSDSSGTAVFANTNLWLANNDNSARELRFFEPQNSTGVFPATNINYTAFKAGGQTDNIVYTLPTVAPTVGQVLSSTADGVLSWITGGGGGGGGTVTNVSVTTANGVSGSVANATTTPAITLTLGAITPTSVAASGSVTGSNLSGTNTGDQVLSDATISTSDITTNNFTTAKHGFVPKGTNLGNFLRDDGTWAAPSGSGDMLAANNLSDLTNLATARTNLGLGTLATQNGTFSGTHSGTSSGTNTGDQTNITGNAATVTTNANLTGPVTSVGNATAIANGAISNAMLANGAVANLSGTNTGDQINIAGNAATVTTNANLTGPVTSVGNTTAIANGAITNAMLANAAVANLSGTNTGDQINIAGNAATVTTNANLTGPVTSVGNATSIGNGAISNAMLANGAVANLSGINTGDQINISGNAATVTTNANLSGPVTSVGNATSIANGAISNAMLANAAVANLTGTNSGDQVISDATITTSDITTNNFTTAKHGFVPKGTNVGNFLKDDGTWAAPSGSGDMLLGSVQTVTGAKTFNSTKLILAGSTSGTTTFNAAATAGTTTITLPAASGTVALLSDITGTNSGVNTGDQVISDATISTTDITTNNVSTVKHGFAPKLPGNTTTFLRGDGTYAVPSGGGGSGTVTSVSVTTANGFGGSVVTATTTPAITVTTSVNGIAKGNGTALSAATSGTDYSAGTSALGTGILKSTTGTGALTIAVAGDFPTLNQNTSGNAATVTTNANLTGPVTSVGNATSIANGAITNAMLANTDVANLSGTNTGDQIISDATITTTNITTNNVSTSKHGFAPRLPGNTTTFLRGDGTYATPSGGGGSVTSVSVTNVNGVSGTVATPTTTPAISLTLGDITPTSVASTGNISGSNLSGTNTGDQDLSNYLLNSNNLSELTSASTARTNLGLGTLATQNGTFSGTSSGTNTGDQTITLTGNVTGTGTGSFVATIANNAVTYARMQVMTTQKLLGSGATGTAVKEVMLGPGLAFFSGPSIDTINTTALVLRYVRDTINVLAPNDVIHNVRLIPQSNATDIDFSISPKGNGALTSVIADNTTVGGNKRGPSSVDWQILRSINDQVASGNQSTIGGGFGNKASGPQSTVAGGILNSATGDQSYVGGGTLDSASGTYSTIGGGSSNRAFGLFSTIAGGVADTTSGAGSAIGGGSSNKVSGDYSFIGGGASNKISGHGASVLGGGYDGTTNASNTASGNATSIGGGLGNTTSGHYSAIPGGRGLTLSGSGSIGFLGNNSAGTSDMSVSANNTAVFGNVDMWLTNNDNTAHELRIYQASGSGAFYSSFKSGAQTGTINYTLPIAAPTVDRQPLIANMDGTQSWAPFIISAVTSNTVSIKPDDGVTADISLELLPKGNGEVRMDANIWLRNGKEIRFYEPGNGNYSSYKAIAQSADINYTIPPAAPTVSGQPLISTAGGAQSWSSLVIGDVSSNELILSPNDNATTDISLVLDAKGAGEVRANDALAVRNANRLKLYESGNGNYTSFEAGNQAADVNYTLPLAAPSAASSGTNLGSGYMETNSSGTMSWRQSITASSTLDFPSTATNVSSDLTLTVTGAATGDIVSIGVPNGSVVANSNYSAWVSSDNTVTIRLNNYSAGTIDPASGTFKVQVTK
ncbi:MAG: hypothetical protein IPM69_01310 [Ignavibacteria bacterium]|nr:hypothetical protein [Ignavibacteria bacterium]